MTLELTQSHLLYGIAGLLALVLVWRFGARRARKAADAARASARAVSLAGRVLVMAAVFVGVQWLVITHPGNTTLLVVVLALPDLIAAYVLARTLTVTDLGATRRRGEKK